MVHYFHTTPEQAHELTKLSKKNGFYFKTLAYTDKIESVPCEVTEKGYDFIKENGIDVSWGYTYDVVFNDEYNSNSKGFRSSKDDCIRYIEQNNGTDTSYFADYKGGIVQVVCNETGGVVYECKVKTSFKKFSYIYGAIDGELAEIIESNGIDIQCDEDMNLLISGDDWELLKQVAPAAIDDFIEL